MKKTTQLFTLLTAALLCSNMLFAQVQTQSGNRNSLNANAKTVFGKLMLRRPASENKRSGHAKKATTKRPLTYLFIEWDQNAGAWTDTSDNSTMTWDANGKLQQITSNEVQEINGVNKKVQYILSDFIIVPDGEGYYESEIFGDDYMYTSGIAKVYNNGNWENYGKFSSTLSASNQIQEELEQEWNGTQWVNVRKQVHSYNQQNQSTGSLGYDWENNAWVNTERTTRKYDVNNRLIEETDEYLENGAWVIDYGSKWTYAYDANKKVTGVESYYYDNQNNNWRGTNKQVYILAGNGEISGSTNYYYDMQNQEWTESSMYDNITWEYFNNNEIYGFPVFIGGNGIKSYTEKMWDNFDNSWHLTNRITNAYNANKQITDMAHEVFNSNNNTWDTIRKTTYAYYNNGDEKEEAQWVKTNGTWEKTSSNENINTYDADGFLLTGTSRSWNKTQGYRNQWMEIYTYTTVVSGINEGVISNALNIYPNPSSNGTLHISLAKPVVGALISVYNTSGKLVMQKMNNTLSSNISVSIGSLASGVYLVQVQNDKDLYRAKLIVQ